MAKIQIGDFCVTPNTTVELQNNRLAVEILDISERSPNAEPRYLIHRKDGEFLPALLNHFTKTPSNSKQQRVWCKEHKRRKVGPKEIPTSRVRIPESTLAGDRA
jgi:hypothetical protein